MLVAALGLTLHWAGILGPSPSRETLVVSTTTSLYDTGLLDVLEDRFEAEYAVDLYFISAGTGLAIQQAQRGDADMILVHAPSVEFAFLQEGYGVDRKIIAYNFFTIVGPAEDPAGIEGLPPAQAMEKIAEAGKRGAATWVSRGDRSGTHLKEIALWEAAGFRVEELRGEDWYLESGAGMGKTLLLAEEKNSYTLADMGTYLKYSAEGHVSLKMLVTQGRELLNVYSAIAVNPEANPHTNLEGAIAFIKFLTSPEGQGIIGDYGVDAYGRPLFHPAVELIETGSDPVLYGWIEEFAFLNGTECPPEYRTPNSGLYD